jgi:hypothetical protein
MRNEKRAIGVKGSGESNLVFVAWALKETVFNVELSRRVQVNRFDLEVAEALWTTHEFAESILPRVTRAF